MLCPKCNESISSKYHYCPMCGEPLTTLAKQREALKLSTAGYEKLNELAESAEDAAVLQAIKNLIANK